MRRNVVLTLKIVRDSIGSALAKLVVVLRIPNRVGSASQSKNVAARFGQVRSEVVELRFVRCREHVFVEGERNADVGELLVVIKVCHHTV